MRAVLFFCDHGSWRLSVQVKANVARLLVSHWRSADARALWARAC